jgi:hypothetical protein
MDGRGLSVAECEDPKTSIKAIKDFLKKNGVSLSNGTARRSSAQLRGIALGIALTGGASSSSVVRRADARCHVILVIFIATIAIMTVRSRTMGRADKHARFYRLSQ